MCPRRRGIPRHCTKPPLGVSPPPCRYARLPCRETDGARLAIRPDRSDRRRPCRGPLARPRAPFEASARRFGQSRVLDLDEFGRRQRAREDLLPRIGPQARPVEPRRLARPAARGEGFHFPWRLVVLIVLGLFGVAAVFQILLLLSGPARTILAPVLAPGTTPTLTLAPSTITPTVTLTPIPVETRILRTPVPPELAGTPLAFLVESTPTPTQMLALTPRPQYEAYAAGIGPPPAGGLGPGGPILRGGVA